MALCRTRTKEDLAYMPGNKTDTVHSTSHNISVQVTDSGCNNTLDNAGIVKKSAKN